jgi:phosphoenolpyruvate carboxykinase (GTP)
VRRDPFAMLPFCGYNMSDYFQHWLDMEHKLEARGHSLPRIYCVNWFRKGADGRFIWPGYGDNMRVLAWILGRIDGTAGGQENIFGVSPRYEDLNWTGLDFSPVKFQQVIGIEPEAWRAELVLHDELFRQLTYHLPAELIATKARIEERLAA